MISKGEIENLAQLARLKLREEEIPALQKDISSILEYVGQVQTGIAAVSGGVEEKPLLRNSMRDDTPRDANDVLAGKREALLTSLPKREGDYAVVRKIIEK